MNIRNIVGITSLLVSASLVQSADITPQARTSAERMAVGTCAGCHGAQGISVLPKFPNLAAQPASYIANQLKAFRSKSRGDPDAQAFMWGMAATLNEGEIDALAQYYSQQHAGPGSNSDVTLSARGKEIYEHGIAARSVPACNSCHGANGEGMAEFPRLAGQHTQYFLNQMRSFQTSYRAADAMQAVVAGLNDTDLVALAAYMQSVSPMTLSAQTVR